jgi:hypothetical protein
MPRFEIVGIGRETGKKRVRVYAADNKDAAIAAASADGTIVDVGKIRQIPQLPATDEQKQYAKSLEIKFPPNISKIEISRLIDAELKKTENENPISEDTLSSATPSQMVEELSNRNLGAILITFDVDKFNFKKGMTGVIFDISRSENLTESQMESILIGMSYQYAKQICPEIEPVKPMVVKKDIIKAECSQCHNIVDVPAEYIGKEIKCPKCKSQFVCENPCQKNNFK